MILLLTFGSVVAAGLPPVMALVGLGVSGSLTGVVAAVAPVPDWSTSLATMIGLGVGIDYALLMVTRFREWRAAGLDPERATVATLDTAGRSVLLAGSTVVISMLGLFAMGLSFMRGAAVVTILAVLVVMAASVTLFPALLGYVGDASTGCASRCRAPPGGRWRGRRHAARLAALEPVRRATPDRRGCRRRGVLLLLAAPFLSTRFGFPDAGNDARGLERAHGVRAHGGGLRAGRQRPAALVAELPAGSGAAGVQRLSAALADTPGVASVAPPQLNAAGDTAVLAVVPTAGPQDPGTEDLVHRLRDDVVPAATAGTPVTVHVGGVTATAIDSTSNIAKRIPLLIGGVVLLSMLLLLVAFRSVLVALKAAVMNLLSVGAAYGVVALVLQGGWAGRLVGIDSPTPLPAFVPVLMFAVLFGLSMDYEVFLVARMREAWTRTGDNATAIVAGAGRDRPGHHRGGRDHDRGVRGLRSEPERRPQGDRHRDGRGDPDRRHGGPAAARARGDAPVRRAELVAAGMARAAAARGARRGPPAALPARARRPRASRRLRGRPPGPSYPD